MKLPTVSFHSLGSLKTNWKGAKSGACHKRLIKRHALSLTTLSWNPYCLTHTAFGVDLSTSGEVHYAPPMGQTFYLVAPRAKKTLAWGGKLGEPLFDGSAMELVRLLAVPVRPQNPALRFGRSLHHIHVLSRAVRGRLVGNTAVILSLCRRRGNCIGGQRSQHLLTTPQASKNQRRR
jgi:hypothetical protein